MNGLYVDKTYTQGEVKPSRADRWKGALANDHDLSMMECDPAIYMLRLHDRAVNLLEVCSASDPKAVAYWTALHVASLANWPRAIQYDLADYMADRGAEVFAHDLREVLSGS